MAGKPLCVPALQQHRQVSILIILANGWKVLQKKWDLTTKAGFNPHHTGEWLESDSIELEAMIIEAVSILIILANGWKEVKKALGNLLMLVSILIILANGWKAPQFFQDHQTVIVSILIILANGWKVVRLSKGIDCL